MIKKHVEKLREKNKDKYIVKIVKECQPTPIISKAEQEYNAQIDAIALELDECRSYFL